MPPMKAMQLVTFGETPRFELTEHPDPKPGPGEVVVALQAAALNRRDRWIWAQPGYCELPVTLGSGGAGVVAGVGRPSGSGTRAAGHAPPVGASALSDPTLG